MGQHHFILKHPDGKESYVNELLKKAWKKESYRVFFIYVDTKGKVFYLVELLIHIVDKKGDVN